MYPQDVFHSTHYLDQLVFFYDFALSNTSEHRAHPCLAIMVHTSPPPPHLSPTLTFKKLFPPFPEVAL